MKAGCQPYWNKFNIKGIQFCKNGTMLKHYTQERNKASMMYRNELIDASQGQGGAVRKRQETHRMAESNRQSAG